MTKTQANELGFVLDAAAKAIYECKGLHLSTGRPWESATAADRYYCLEYAGAALAAAPLVPSPAYGAVRALEWTNVGRCIGWSADDEQTHLYHATGLDRLYEVEMGKVGWWAKWRGGFHAKELPSLAEAKAACQADFDRRVLSCLSPVAVEEADAKAAEPGDFLTRLRDANRTRDAEYRAKTNGEPLPILFRTTEFAGEVGELLNVIKKMERERLGWGGKRATREAMLEEFGGAFATFDLLAMTLDVDLAEATAAEFNAVTERLGLTTYLAAAPSTLSPQIGKAGAGPVGEMVAWRFEELHVGFGGQKSWHWRYSEIHPGQRPDIRNVQPLYARPAEEPGEVVRTAASYHESWLHEADRADTAEAALAETRERLEKELRRAGFALDEALSVIDAEADPVTYSRLQAAAGRTRAVLTGDAQEGGK